VAEKEEEEEEEEKKEKRKKKKKKIKTYWLKRYQDREPLRPDW